MDVSLISFFPGYVVSVHSPNKPMAAKNSGGNADGDSGKGTERVEKKKGKFRIESNRNLVAYASLVYKATNTQVIFEGDFDTDLEALKLNVQLSPSMFEKLDWVGTIGDENTELVGSRYRFAPIGPNAETAHPAIEAVVPLQ